MSVQTVIFVVISSKYIDVLVTGATSSWQEANPQLGRTGSAFSVRSDCLNEVKAGPCRRQLSKYAESSAVGLPGAGNWTALLGEGVV